MSSDHPVTDQLHADATRTVKKGEFLLRAGEPTSHIYYVRKGCLRSYIIDDKGREHVYQFAPEDWLISDEQALMEGAPATLFIDAIEDTEVVELKRPAGSWTNDLDPDTANDLITRLERKINAFRNRILLLLSATAEERYANFLEIYPGLAQRVPQKMIASYIGVTPESLSRVRKDMTHR